MVIARNDSWLSCSMKSGPAVLLHGRLERLARLGLHVAEDLKVQAQVLRVVGERLEQLGDRARPARVRGVLVGRVEDGTGALRVRLVVLGVGEEPAADERDRHRGVRVRLRVLHEPAQHAPERVGVDAVPLCADRGQVVHVAVLLDAHKGRAVVHLARVLLCVLGALLGRRGALGLGGHRVQLLRFDRLSRRRRDGLLAVVAPHDGLLALARARAARATGAPTSRPPRPRRRRWPWGRAAPS